MLAIKLTTVGGASLASVLFPKKTRHMVHLFQAMSRSYNSYSFRAVLLETATDQEEKRHKEEENPAH